MFLLSTLLFGCNEEEITRFEELEYDNLPPYSAIIDLEPATPITTDSLEALIIAESTDPNDDAVTLSYMWFKNDELQTDLTESTVSADLTETPRNVIAEICLLVGQTSSFNLKKLKSFVC